jgi:hypothetical protein
VIYLPSEDLSGDDWKSRTRSYDRVGVDNEVLALIAGWESRVAKGVCRW